MGAWERSFFIFLIIISVIPFLSVHDFFLHNIIVIKMIAQFHGEVPLWKFFRIIRLRKSSMNEVPPIFVEYFSCDSFQQNFVLTNYWVLNPLFDFFDDFLQRNLTHFFDVCRFWIISCSDNLKLTLVVTIVLFDMLFKIFANHISSPIFVFFWHLGVAHVIFFLPLSVLSCPLVLNFFFVKVLCGLLRRTTYGKSLLADVWFGFLYMVVHRCSTVAFIFATVTWVLFLNLNWHTEFNRNF